MTAKKRCGSISKLVQRKKGAGQVARATSLR